MAEMEARLAVDLPGDETPDDDIPDMTDPYWTKGFRAARLRRDSIAKVKTTVFLSSDVLAYFKADGPGWQTRIDAALRKAAGLEP